MICWRTTLFQLQNINIFAILSSILILATIFCNLFVIAVIKNLKKRKISNLFLLSLSISDLCVGMVLGPFTIIQVLDVDLLLSCRAHFVRGYLLVLLVGSSLLTLAAVSYDRYLLLTKLTNYNKYMTENKAFFIILFCWLFPGLIPIVKSFNMTTYVVLRITTCSFPLVTLGTFYYLITKEVYTKRFKFLQNKTNNNIVVNDFSLMCNENIDYLIDKNTANISNSATLSVHLFNTKNTRNYKNRIRVAKSVTLLIACYFAFIFPLNIWMILELSNLEYNTKAHQIFYLCAVFLMQANSCINPIIYYSKQSDIKKGFLQIFKPFITENRILKKRRRFKK
ncbi:adenosine receptor A3 isoform X2 [Hydra vulgaris]|uniref:Adenosine receptor A3 isoform X2 n=1 Tax=Hydra vulgaris TaxID=6087 RepID=A0ABM4D1Z9_HYDVU